MRREVIVSGKSIHVELRRNRDQVDFQVEGGAAESASIIEVQPGVYSVLVNGKSFEARLIQGNSSVTVHLNGQSYEIQIVDPREPNRMHADVSRQGPQTLTAPMPGKIVRVLVAEGDPVQAGTGLLVMEAMKMQNEIKADKAGNVVSIPVRAGDAVSTGDVLAIVE
jgi:biotin carboxyl carrier protein